MKSHYKKLDTRSHFSDFWHRAKSWRTNKKIGSRAERRKLNREAEGANHEHQTDMESPKDRTQSTMEEEV